MLNQSNQSDARMLTNPEVQTIILALHKARQTKGGRVTKRDAQKIIKWADDTLINAEVIQGVLDGLYLIDLRKDGEIEVIPTPKAMEVPA